MPKKIILDSKNIFNEARYFIKTEFEHDLNLIELVYLKHYCEKTTTEFNTAKNQFGPDGFDPEIEASIRFFHDIYNIRPERFYSENRSKLNKEIRFIKDEMYLM